MKRILFCLMLISTLQLDAVRQDYDRVLEDDNLTRPQKEFYEFVLYLSDTSNSFCSVVQESPVKTVLTVGGVVVGTSILGAFWRALSDEDRKSIKTTSSLTVLMALLVYLVDLEASKLNNDNSDSD